MKTMIRLFALAALVMTFALASLAQTPTTATTPAAGAPQVDEKAKADLYAKFLADRKGDAAAQKRAYETGKEYLAKYSTPEDDIFAFVKKWVNNYEGATREFAYSEALRTKNYAEAFRLGREILAAKPERTQIVVALGWTGYSAFANEKNEAFIGDGGNYINQALQLIDSGKEPMGVNEKGESVALWAPFNNRDEAISYLRFAQASLALKNKNTEQAAKYFHKITQQPGLFKNEASTYANLGAAYANSPEYTKLISDYAALVKTNPDAAGSDEAKAIIAKSDPLTDRIIDAYARAVALSNATPVPSDPKQAAAKAEAKMNYMQRLTEFYKFRNNNEDKGLTEFIAGVLAKPVPSVEPPAAMPTPTPATSGAGNGAMTTTPAATTTSTMPATTTTTPPATAQPAATTTTTTAKPAPTSAKPAPMPAKPKP